MSCHNCGDKTSSRYSAMNVSPDIDANKKNMDAKINMPGPTHQPARGFSDPSPADALSAFVGVKKLSYEELKERRDMQHRMIDSQQNQLLLEMSDAMRRMHIDELVYSANGDRRGIPGMSPKQALITLKETLDRPEFDTVLAFYPGLKEAVASQFERLLEERLPMPE